MNFYNPVSNTRCHSIGHKENIKNNIKKIMPLFGINLKWIFRCNGWNSSQLEIGSCGTKDPCSLNPCKSSEFRYELSTVGPCGFFYAGPVAWNSLQSVLKDPSLSFTMFKKLLKTELFNWMSFTTACAFVAVCLKGVDAIPV